MAVAPSALAAPPEPAAPVLAASSEQAGPVQAIPVMGQSVRVEDGYGLIVPTLRTVQILTLLVPLALLVSAVVPSLWALPLFVALGVLGAAVWDAVRGGRLDSVTLEIPADAEVGEPFVAAIVPRFSGGRAQEGQAAWQCDPRLAEGGRLTCALLPQADSDTGSPTPLWRGEAAFTPSRRGTGRVEQVWLRWSGPWGLGARQWTGPVAKTVRVWPNVAATRSPAMQTYLRESQSGLLARRIRGEGTQFESLAEYQPGMDRRRIDWKSSARHVHLYAKEYEAERNNPIVFAFDCGQSMCEPIAGMPRLDRAISAALATAFVALKSGDRVALFGFASRPEVATPFVTQSSAFYRLQQAASALEYRSEEPNFTLGLATLAGRLQRRSLIVVFSDFTDPTSAELMIESIGRLVSRHVVVFVTIADEELENLRSASPEDMEALSMSVSADLLLRQREGVTRRLRQMGVDVVEAPWQSIGTRLLDTYLAIKRTGAIG